LKRKFENTRMKEKKKLEDIVNYNYKLCLKFSIEFLDSLADDINKISLD